MSSSWISCNFNKNHQYHSRVLSCFWPRGCLPGRSLVTPPCAQTSSWRAARLPRASARLPRADAACASLRATQHPFPPVRAAESAQVQGENINPSAQQARPHGAVQRAGGWGAADAGPLEKAVHCPVLLGTQGLSVSVFLGLKRVPFSCRELGFIFPSCARSCLPLHLPPSPKVLMASCVRGHCLPGSLFCGVCTFSLYSSGILKGWDPTHIISAY